MTSLMTPEAFAAMSFDYLIAGGGTAGLILADRLSEIPTVSVGVIEAGEDLTSDPKVTTPCTCSICRAILSTTGTC